jgi:FKBP-type peptidyl-prolyl cis-trans isomerase
MKRFGAILAALTAFLSLAATEVKSADPALSSQANAAYLADNAHKPGVVTRPSGLQYSIIKSGLGGRRPLSTYEVDVAYIGMLINGKVFDGTEPTTPAHLTINKLIPGWTEALQLMRVGDKWHLVIPANLAYGARGAGDGLIPPNQVLVFDMELLGFSLPKRPPPGQDPDNPDGGQ